MHQNAIGFLSRLSRDTGGNVMAMTAAMIFPMIGLVGGAVDMSRLYATKTRLQAACDAGALAGRRTMGVNTWAASSNAANTQAQKVFTLNFRPGAFASTNQSATFTENSGTVNGTATAQVPMTLMRVFGMPTSTVTVNCQSMMVIPNTDVMFVLDTTGSMAGTRIAGLKDATKCFYEALAKEDTDADCGSTPSGGISSAVQLRFGFMPYATNVNVGKLLKTEWFADNWDRYDSRIVNTTPVWGYTLGDESGVTWGNYGNPGDMLDQSKYGTWTDTTITPSNAAIAVNLAAGTTALARRTSDTATGNCTARNNQGTATSKLAGWANTGSPGTEAAATSGSYTPAAPDHSASPIPTVQTKTWSQNRNHTAIGYRYAWNSGGAAGDKCRLQYSANRTYSQGKTGTQTRPINWTQYNKFTNYTYQKASLNVSSFKNGAVWKDTTVTPATIPNLDTATTNIFESGQTTESTISIPTDRTVTWDGCIEEAYEPNGATFTTASDGIPSNAFGAQIDLVPNSADSRTLWAPALPDAVWGRYTSTYGTERQCTWSWSSGYTCRDVAVEYKTNTYDSVTRTEDLTRDRYSYVCPNEARKLQRWTKDDYEDYIDGLTVSGNTYHDVGLVWGGRFLSPDGIFHDENFETPGGAQIYRHMIFMTDGDTQTAPTNYTSQGVPWWARRQTSEGTPPTDSQLDTVVNNRFSAICAAIKRKGIVLWVVSYGGSTSGTTNDRLRNCSSDQTIANATTGESTRFFLASNRAALITRFQQIANQISSLRLTN